MQLRATLLRYIFVRLQLVIVHPQTIAKPVFLPLKLYYPSNVFYNSITTQRIDSLSMLNVFILLRSIFFLHHRGRTFSIGSRTSGDKRARLDRALSPFSHRAIPPMKLNLSTVRLSREPRDTHPPIEGLARRHRSPALRRYPGSHGSSAVRADRTDRARPRRKNTPCFSLNAQYPRLR